MNGTNRCSGRVEVYHEGQWGTICDHWWDSTEAQVLCRQVGCGTALTAKSKAFFGEGLSQIWLEMLKCNGNERSLDTCEHKLYGVHNCNHAEDVGVICSSKLHDLLSEWIMLFLTSIYVSCHSLDDS